MGLIRKYKKLIIPLVILTIVLFIGTKLILGRNQSKQKSSPVLPVKSETLNKEFAFPVTTNDGSKINIKFVVQDASLNNEIVIQGQSANAIPGRIFLIVTLKLTNELNNAMSINTRDYVRLSVNGDENTWLAPDIHNDPVEVQAISTKFTRVGFAINTSDKNLKLQIGEIRGDKQKIDLKL